MLAALLARIYTIGGALSLAFANTFTATFLRFILAMLCGKRFWDTKKVYLRADINSLLITSDSEVLLFKLCGCLLESFNAQTARSRCVRVMVVL